MNGSDDRAVLAGQAAYTKTILRVYDLLVLGVSNRFIWKCPAHRLLAHYDRHVTANHLDVGVGTGYFLDKSRFPSANPRIALIDLNPNALETTARRIARYKPAVYRHNVLEPLRIDGQGFDSVAMNYLLHCLPGTFEAKFAAVDHITALMNPGAVLFGATILQDHVNRGRVAKGLSALYNDRGIFCNREDHFDTLKEAMSRRFRDVSIETVGCVALFSGRL